MTRRLLPVFVLGAAAALASQLGAQGPAGRAASSAAPAVSPVASPAAMPADVRQTIDRYCTTCHTDRVSTSATAGGVVFNEGTLSSLASHPSVWERVVRKVRTGAMPPEGMPRPDAHAVARLLTYVEGSLDRAAAERPDPGRPAVHRLNRAEYANAIRDLLALEVDAAALLPPDDSAAGFDNNADILGLSPTLLERYVSAAARVSALAVGSPAISASSSTYRIRGDGSQTLHEDGLPLGTRGGVLGLHSFPLDGEYVIKVKLLETNLGSIRGLEQTHQLEITVDGERVLLAPVGGPEDYTESSRNATNVVNSLERRLQARVHVRAGQRPVTAAFVQKSSALGGTRLQPFERSTVIATDHLGLPHVENMVVSGPFNAAGPGDTPSRRRVFICRPAAPAAEPACATRIIRHLARLAYRRTPTGDEVDALMRFYRSGRTESFEAGVELALRALLASPRFLLRVETDPPGLAEGASYALDGAALASRLSFFLWSSIPDAELLDAAERGELKTPAGLSRQVRRMLADARAAALTGNFAGQWLQIRNIRSSTPDKNDFPDFDDNLRRAFEKELELFFASIVNEDRNVLDLLTADYSFLNERLAVHYGIPHVYGSHFRRVTNLPDHRRGLIGKGGVLLVTSHADRTSPVVRGKWILDNLLGIPPPPPPPDVPALPEPAGAAAPLTMRARLEQHRANPVCASCHKLMDPLGLSLENFDAVGRWRNEEAGRPIDASTVYFDGTPLEGVASLRTVLLAKPEVVVGTMAEKLLTYALGRGLEPSDMPAVRGIVRHAAAQGYRFSALVDGVVRSAPFMMRRAES